MSVYTRTNVPMRKGLSKELSGRAQVHALIFAAIKRALRLEQTTHMEECLGVTIPSRPRLPCVQKSAVPFMFLVALIALIPANLSGLLLQRLQFVAPL